MTKSGFDRGGNLGVARLNPDEWVEALRESMVSGLRRKGWSRIDAATEVEDRIDAIRNQEQAA